MPGYALQLCIILDSFNIHFLNYVFGFVVATRNVISALPYFLHNGSDIMTPTTEGQNDSKPQKDLTDVFPVQVPRLEDSCPNEVTLRLLQASDFL